MNGVQMDIRDGHQVTIDTVLAWCDETPEQLKVRERERARANTSGTRTLGASPNLLVDTESVVLKRVSQKAER